MSFLSRGVLGKLKGRTFLILVAILTGLIILTTINAVLINMWKDHDSEVRSKIISGLSVTTAKDLGWQVKTQAGNLVVQGKVTIPKDQCARFNEMDGSYCAASVTKTEEIYTRHERKYDCGADAHPRTCTEVYWSWDLAGSWSDQASNGVILGKTLPYSWLRASEDRVDPSVIGINGCRFRYCYEGSGIRYSYKAAPGRYSGVAYLTSDSDGLSSFNGFDEDETADGAKNAAQHPSVIPDVVFWIVEFILMAAASAIGFTVVRNDLDDGADNDF
jgi:hypothetical protein